MAAPDPATQERVYRAIRYDLGAGRLRPGERLEAMRLARLHGSSITPVREALYRLVGEHCVDLHAGGGFSVPILGREAVVALYDCNRRFLLACLRQRGLMVAASSDRRLFRPGTHVLDYADRVSTLFIEFAEWSGNMACVALVRHLNGQMAALRNAEIRALIDPSREIGHLEELARVPGHALLPRALQAYHQRRMKAAALICAALLG